MTRRSWRSALAASAAAAALLLGGAPAASAAPVLDEGVELYVNPKSTTVQAARHLKGEARADAQTLAGYASATWFTGKTPLQTEKAVAKLTRGAAKQDEVPVLVAYNLPFRDCAQYSAGGATSVAEYQAWIDAMARGIGDREAVVILEPDGLGIIPWYTNTDGQLEWCQPAEADAATAAADRYAMLNYAVDVLGANPGTAVYLDATHTGWLNVGEITDRLVRAGVARADGFFLNASNYQWTENLEQYGTWISSCLALVTEAGLDTADCPNQYWNGGPSNGFNGVALDPYGIWSDDATTANLNTLGINERYAALLAQEGVEPTTHFVIDTSRNGQGPWQPPADWPGDPETWCNPPDRGLGIAPTTDTGNELVDAYLWIKVPGESDGQCFRGTGGPLDPIRGMADPAAGQWFPEQARELLELAVLEP